MLPNNGYLIDGEYGSGKTTYATKLILDYLNKTDYFIFTDIKLHNIPKHQQKRVFFYDATRLVTFGQKVNQYSEKPKTMIYYNIMDILEIMRLMRNEWDKSGLGRNDRQGFALFFDETGAIFNKYNIEDSALTELYDYMVQIRKLNGRVYLISQEHQYMTLRIRSLCTTVFYNTKLPILGDDTLRPGGLPRFNSFSLIYRKKVDPETSMVQTEKYMERNENGRLVINEKPLISYQDWIYRPKYRKFYDDLYMNMKTTVRFPLSPESLNNYELLKSLFNEKHFKKLEKPFTKKLLTNATIED